MAVASGRACAARSIAVNLRVVELGRRPTFNLPYGVLALADADLAVLRGRPRRVSIAGVERKAKPGESRIRSGPLGSPGHSLGGVDD